jgi:hypothetical protein
LSLTSATIATLTAVSGDTTGGISSTATKRSSESSLPAFVGPRETTLGLRTICQREHFHNAFPNRFAAKNFFHRHRLDVLRVGFVQVENHLFQPFDAIFIRHSF